MSDKFKKVAIILVVLGFLFWHPLTRQIMLFILPLGSGLDDFIFLMAFVGGGIFWAASQVKKDNLKWSTVIWIVVSIVALLVGFFVAASFLA